MFSTIIVNGDTVNHSIRLPIAVLKYDTVVAATDPFMLPDLLVPPGTTVFYAEQIIWPEVVRQYRMYVRGILPGGRLLPGEYRLCVGGVEELGRYTGGICSTFRIDPWPALHPVAPATGDTVSLPVTLRWNDIALYPEDRIGYRLKIVPLLAGQSPIEAFRTNAAVFDHTTNAVEWSLDRHDLPNSARACVWSVEALDEQGYTIGDGWTAPSMMIVENIP